MLTTIQDLEHEIDQFHKNIKDSNELMKILISVASLTKKQTESFEIRTTALQDELAKLPLELSELFQRKTEALVQTLHDEQKQIQEQYATDLAKANEVSAKQLEAKYDAFIAKLEVINMHQLYKYCQDMNKSINTKLGLALSGIVIAVIASIISFFI